MKNNVLVYLSIYLYMYLCDYISFVIMFVCLCLSILCFFFLCLYNNVLVFWFTFTSCYLLYEYLRCLVLFTIFIVVFSVRMCVCVAVSVYENKSIDKLSQHGLFEFHINYYVKII